METIGFQGLKDRVINNPQINFCAFLITPWQTHGVNAFIQFKKDQGIELNGIICIEKSTQAGYLIDDSYFIQSNNIAIVKYDPTIETRTIKSVLQEARDARRGCLASPVSNKRDIYLLSYSNPEFKVHAYFKRNLHREPLSVIIDEGLGIYMRNDFEKLCEMLSFKTSIIRKIIQIYHCLIRNPILLQKMESYNAIYRFTIFNRENHALTQNDVAIEYYKKTLTAVQHREYGQIKAYERAVVINTQPYFEMGQMRNDLDVEAIKFICDECKKQNCAVLLKPHPREKNLERYAGIENLVIDTNKEESQESIIASLHVKPAVVIGFTSTTLVSLKVLFDVNTISLAPCFIKQKVGPRLREDCKDFYKTFSKSVPCVATRDELLVEIRRCIAAAERGKCSEILSARAVDISELSK